MARAPNQRYGPIMKIDWVPLAQVETATGAGASPAGGAGAPSAYDRPRPPQGCGGPEQIALLIILVFGFVALVIVLALRKPRRDPDALPASPGVTDRGASIAERLKNLKGLHDAALISDQEFERRKGEIIREL